MRALTASATAFLLAFLAAPAAAQTTVNDIGLTMDGGVLTVIYGRSCAPFSCTPTPAGTVGGGEVRTVTCFGAPGTACLVALGLPLPACFPFPGLDNSLMLDPSQLATIGFGITGNLGISICPATGSRITFNVPPVVPPGIVFRIQGVAHSPSTGLPAFTIALESVTL